MSDDKELIPVVAVSGERGKTGDRGQRGEVGQTGLAGKSAVPLSRLHALAMFGLIVLVGVILTWIGTQQNHRIQAQQQAINTNTEAIRESQYQGCLGGLAIIRQFNEQQDALAQIDRDITVKSGPEGKRIGEARIKAYEAGKIPIAADYECVR